MAHGREELRFGPVGTFGGIAGALMHANLALEAGVGLGQLLGALVDQPFELDLVPPEFGLGSFALTLQFTLDDRLVLENLYRGRHVAQLVGAGHLNRDAQVSLGQLAHGAGEAGQAPDDVALHIEPDDQPGYGEKEQRLHDEGQEATAHRGLGIVGRRRGERFGLIDETCHMTAQVLREVAVGARQPGQLRLDLEDLAALLDGVGGAGSGNRHEPVQQRSRLFQAHRIADAADPTLEYAQVVFQGARDPVHLFNTGGPPQLVKQEPNLRAAHAQLEHPLQ